MIHLLEINSETQPASLAKQVRRLAMTGGLEMTIDPGLGAQDLARLAELFIPELQKYQPLTSKWQACTANRLLKLVCDHKNADERLNGRLAALLNLEVEVGKIDVQSGHKNTNC